MKRYLAIFLLLSSLWLHAQHDQRYYEPSDPLIREKISQWQDLKFGLLMHWGAYSQWGIVESWSLCPEEYGWCERTAGSDPNNYFHYKQEYEGLIRTFNPVHFDPEKWAEAARKAGMKYLVFTTKHHDGFCMFDSKYTNYKITSPDCPFSVNPKSNVTKEMLDAFRDQGFWAGVYFSKPDWHVPSYWDPKYPPRDRNVNYDPAENPEKWKEFTDFTHNQILELLSDYGKIDILWLDGGWVARESKESITSWYDAQLKQSDLGYLKHRIINQDIQMDELVKRAREKQPGLIVVDRAVEGPNQNYLTPENRVPETPLPYPWESCIISGGSWSWIPNPDYMSSREAVQLLVDIVSKGGNLLLNIAPGPDGRWDEGAYQLLEGIGKWMDVNKEAIYNSRALSPYSEDNLRMTQQKDGRAHFFYIAGENEREMPRMILIRSHQPKPGSSVRLLGSEEDINWTPAKNGFKILIPETTAKNPPCDDVWVFEVDALQ